MNISHSETLKGLAETCPAYQELKQHVIDHLAGADCILEASLKDITSITKTVKNIQKVQQIHQEVISKIRGEVNNHA